MANNQKRTKKSKEPPKYNNLVPKKCELYDFEHIQTSTLGRLGEIASVVEFIKHDIPVYLPVTELEEVDMIAKFDGKLQKIQTKTSATRVNQYNGGVRFKLTNTDHHVKRGKLHSGSHKYRITDIDYFTLYDALTDKVFILPNNEDKTSITINSDPIIYAKNVRNGSDYEIGEFLSALNMEDE